MTVSLSWTSKSPKKISLNIFCKNVGCKVRLPFSNLISWTLLLFFSYSIIVLLMRSDVTLAASTSTTQLCAVATSITWSLSFPPFSSRSGGGPSVGDKKNWKLTLNQSYQKVWREECTLECFDWSSRGSRLARKTCLFRWHFGDQLAIAYRCIVLHVGATPFAPWGALSGQMCLSVSLVRTV